MIETRDESDGEAERQGGKEARRQGGFLNWNRSQVLNRIYYKKENRFHKFIDARQCTLLNVADDVGPEMCRRAGCADGRGGLKMLKVLKNFI